MIFPPKTRKCLFGISNFERVVGNAINDLYKQLIKYLKSDFEKLEAFLFFLGHPLFRVFSIQCSMFIP